MFDYTLFSKIAIVMWRYSVKWRIILLLFWILDVINAQQQSTPSSVGVHFSIVVFLFILLMVLVFVCCVCIFNTSLILILCIQNLVISTYVGTGTQGTSNDGGQASVSNLMSPTYMAVDTAGNLFFTDNHGIRYIAKATGIITTIAGNVLVPGSSGDNGPAISAFLNYPGGITVAGNGDLYIADTTNHAIRYVSQSIISSSGGTLGTAGSTGDGGVFSSAYLYNPTAIALDSNGKLYIADTGNHVIRVVSSGIISLFAGITLTTPSNVMTSSVDIPSSLISPFLLIKKNVDSFTFFLLLHSFLIDVVVRWMDIRVHRR